MSSIRTASIASLNRLKWDFSYATTISVFVIEFILYSPLLSFGVVFLKFVENETFTEKDGLWIPVVFIASWKFANPWSKHVCELFEDQYFHQKWIMTISTILMVLSFVGASFLPNLGWLTLLYACFGGVAISLLDSQIKISTFEDFQSKPRILEGLRQLSRAIGLFVTPHIIFHLAVEYDLRSTQLIYSLLLLHIIPAGLILTRIKKTEFKSNLNKYRTQSGLLDDPNIIELSAIKARLFSPVENVNNIQKIFYSPDDDFDEDGEQNSRPKTAMGVEIMPKIEEESETESQAESEEETPKNHYKNSIKRYSRVSEKFEEIISKQNHYRQNHQLKMSGDVLLTVNNIGDLKSTSTYSVDRRDSYVNCFSPYKKINLRKKYAVAKSLLKENVSRPFWDSLKVFYFYPALFTKSTTYFMTTVFIVAVPQIGLVNGTYKENVVYTQLEAVFLLSLISFSWMFFLITLTWLIDMSKLRLRVVNVFGLLVCSVCCYLLSKYLSHELITLNCFIFGFGYGIVVYTEDIVIRESLGVRQSLKTDGTLNVLSGICVIIIYFIFYMANCTLIECFRPFSVIFVINMLLWIVMPVFKFLWDYCKSNSQRDSLMISSF